MKPNVNFDFELSSLIDPVCCDLMKCKVIYDDSEILSVDYSPYVKKNIKSFRLITSNDICYSRKYTNRDHIDQLYQEKKDSDEIIIIKNNHIYIFNKAHLLAGPSQK